MSIQGLRTTGNFSPAEVRPKNWREGILLQYPNGAFPLFALTSQMRKESTDDPEFSWFEKRLDARRLQVNGAVSSTSATSVTVDSGAKVVVAKTMLYVEATGEILFVSADPATDTALTVARGFAGTTAAAIPDDAQLLVIGTAFEEGSLAPTGQAYDPYKRFNYTQIFRRTLEITGTAAKTRLRTGDAVKEAKREALEYISIDIERSMWFGSRSQDTYDGKPRRTMGGVLNQLPASNIFDANISGGVDYDTLEGWIKDLFKYGSQEKMVFCGDQALLTIQRIIRNSPSSTWTWTPQTKEYGMNVTRLVTPFGTLVFKTCPLFNQSTSSGLGTATPVFGFDSYAFVLDMANVKYVYMDGRDLKYEPNLTAVGLDGEKSGYIAECSIKIEHLENHGLIKNLAVAKEYVQKTEAITAGGSGESTGTGS